MTFAALYRLELRGMLECPIVGVAKEDWSEEELRTHARGAVAQAETEVDGAAFDRLAARLSYLSGDLRDPALYERLRARIPDARRAMFYLEIPPSMFADVVRMLVGA